MRVSSSYPSGPTERRRRIWISKCPSTIQTAPSSCQGKTASRRPAKKMTMSTPPSRTRWSTRTCWERGERSAFTENSTHTDPSRGAQTHKSRWSPETPIRTRRTKGNSSFRRPLKSLPRFPTDLWATTKAWWTMSFTGLRTKVKRRTLWIWGRGSIQREETDERIGFGLLLLTWPTWTLRFSISSHLCDFAFAVFSFFFSFSSTHFPRSQAHKITLFQTVTLFVSQMKKHSLLKATQRRPFATHGPIKQKCGNSSLSLRMCCTYDRCFLRSMCVLFTCCSFAIHRLQRLVTVFAPAVHVYIVYVPYRKVRAIQPKTVSAIFGVQTNEIKLLFGPISGLIRFLWFLLVCVRVVEKYL